MSRPSPSRPSRFLTASGAILALLLTQAGSPGGPFASTRLDDSRRRLDSLAAEQEELRARLAELERREEGGAARLERLEAQGESRRRLRGQLATELALLQAGEKLQTEELAQGELRLDSLGLARAEAAARRELLRGETAALARRLFPLRHRDPLGLWLQADSAAQASRGLRRLPWLAAGLRRRLDALAEAQRLLGGLEAAQEEEAAQRRVLLGQLERDQRRAVAARAEASRELERLQAEQAEQGRLLQELRRDRQRAAAQAARLKSAGEEVARQVAELQRRWTEREVRRQSESRRQDAVARRLADSPNPPADAPAPVPAPAPAGKGATPSPQSLVGRQGSLPAPVVGRVARPFGPRQDPVLGTVLDNPGLDFACAAGAPVSAVLAGRMEKATWVAGFGNTLLLSHGAGGWTVYARLEEPAVREGQTVAAGQVLGRAGRAEDGGGALHFEIWLDGRAQDPGRWLKP